MAGSYKGGRPQGRQKAWPFPKGWADGPDVSDDELVKLRNKALKAILTSDDVGQMERTTALKILGPWKRETADEGQKDLLALRDRVFGVVEGGKQ